jgi:hypothetical protein
MLIIVISGCNSGNVYETGGMIDYTDNSAPNSSEGNVSDQTPDEGEFIVIDVDAGNLSQRKKI